MTRCPAGIPRAERLNVRSVKETRLIFAVDVRERLRLPSNNEISIAFPHDLPLVYDRESYACIPSYTRRQFYSSGKP